jgi:hypothetical protein
MSTNDEIGRREYLLDRLRDKSITWDQAIELRNILEDEKQRAFKLGDVAVLLGVLILLGLVLDYLSKNKLSHIFGFKSNKKRS